MAPSAWSWRHPGLKGVTPAGSARRGRRDVDSDTRSPSAWNLVVDLATTARVI